MKTPEKFAHHYLPHSLSRDLTFKCYAKIQRPAGIRVIKRVSQRFSSFYFSPVDKNTVLKEIRKLKYNNAEQDTDIHVKILKYNAEFFAEYIYLQHNETIRPSSFPYCFKFPNIEAAFIPGSRNQKNNYRSISILPLISKIFEKLICRKLSNYLDNILSKFQCDFTRGYSPQQSLLLMIDKRKKAVDSSKVFEAVLTDLLKAFDCICHDLLIAKPKSYGLSLPFLKLIID